MTPGGGGAALAAVVTIDLPCHSAENGDLIVMEAMRHVPFAIARVFAVRAAPGSTRGQHAHKRCTQFFTCPVGTIEVVCDDGTETGRFLLDRPDLGLLVPPGIWSQQTYVAPGSVLTVLCDRAYEADDYIRDYAAFRQFRAPSRNLG